MSGQALAASASVLVTETVPTQVLNPSGGQVAALMTEQAMTAILTTCVRLGVSGVACRAQAPNRCAAIPHLQRTA